MKTKVITEQEAKAIIKSIPRGQFFSMQYRKKDGTFREAVCQLGVRNSSTLPSPKGTGETAQEALERGRIKYYEPHHRNDDGTVSPAYRQASIDRLHTICTCGKVYVVDHKQGQHTYIQPYGE